jgi:hypothetical protein
MQLIAIDDMVVMIPAAMLHQPAVIMAVIMMEDGHRTTHRSVLPSAMISQTPSAREEQALCKRRSKRRHQQ